MVEPYVLLLKSEGKYNSLIKVTKDTDPSGMKIGSLLLVKSQNLMTYFLRVEEIKDV